MQPILVPLGNAQLVAGLHWQEINPRIRFRQAAKENAADYYIGLKGDPTLLGTVSLASHDKPLGSLALQVLPQLPPNCYAIFELANAQYWLICTVDGVLSTLSDIVGDADTIKQVANTFLHSYSSEIAWSVIAPANFFDDAKTIAIEDVLGHKLHRNALLKRTQDKRPLIIAGLAIAAGLLAFYGYQHYQDKLQRARVAAAQAALKARQAALKAGQKHLAPWEKLPTVTDLVQTCETAWQAAPISIAGWVFAGADCNKESITFHYSKPPGVTVSDFASRLPAFYPQGRAQFNIPGPSNAGGFSLPLHLATSSTQEELPEQQQQLQRLTSFAQRINAELKIAPQNALIQDNQGQPITQPWLTWGFTLTTDIPPNRLFVDDRFDGSGIRVTQIIVKNTNNRLFYTLEGLLYANR